MKKIFLLLGIMVCQSGFSNSTTYTLDLIPFALSFENNLGGQKIRLFVRSIGNLRYLSKTAKFKIGDEYFKGQLWNYKTKKVAQTNNDKLTLGEFGYYEAETKGSLLDHCKITNVHIELENSFQTGRGTADNDQRDLTAFEKGNTSECDELPLRMRKPVGQGIEL